MSEIYGMFVECEKEKAEKETEDRLWSLYIRSLSEKSFTDWKKDIYRENAREASDEILTREEINASIKKSQDILQSFVPDDGG